MPASTQNASQYVLNRPLVYQQRHKMLLNMCWARTNSENKKIHLIICWSNVSHATEDTKFISTCVYQTHPMPARTQYVTQLVLTYPILCQWGHKIYLNLCWPKLYQYSEET